MAIPLPDNESRRIIALQRYDVLDTPPEEAFDRITRILAAFLEVPIALVTLVDETRHWLKSHHGLDDVGQPPREGSFCSYAIMGDDPMVVPDATKDSRFVDNPLVTGELGLRFYCGAPLRTKEGYNLGTLCALDHRPRRVTETQLRALVDLAHLVVDELELRLAAKNALEAEVANRRRAEEALRSSEQLLKTVLDHSPAQICLKDLAGRHILVNREVERLYGRPDETLIGKVAHDLFPEAYADTDVAHDRAVLETGRAITREYEVQHDDGPRTYLSVKFPVQGVENDQPTIGSITSDITERRSIEVQLRQAQKMEAMGQLTGGVAHDFNNLLAVIMGNAEILQARLGPEEPLTRAVIQAAARGAELTQRLLAFSRQQSLRPQAVNLEALVAGLNEMLGRTLGETIEIEIQSNPGIWPAMADPGQLESAILNLAINARDAMPSGGRLTIEIGALMADETHTAFEEEFSPGQYVTLTVNDTGCGIPGDALEHVFEPFFTTKEVGQGTGLGLSMVYGFAKQSGGHVTLCSAEGQGTTVKLYLPRAETPAEQPQPAAKPREPRAGGETILVVEDDAEVRRLAVRLLEELGYRVLQAAQGHDAEVILRKTTRVDLLFSDVVLPGAMSGPELAALAKRRHPSLAVLFMSGYAENVIHHPELAGNAELLNKPFGRCDLARQVRHALESQGSSCKPCLGANH